MKKYFLSLILVSLYFLANAGESACIPVTGQNEVVVSVTGLPHADLEISVHGGLTVTYINHATKKINWDGPFTAKRVADYPLSITPFHITASSLHSKRYLLHIHPSHHFW